MIGLPTAAYEYIRRKPVVGIPYGEWGKDFQVLGLWVEYLTI